MSNSDTQKEDSKKESSSMNPEMSDVAEEFGRLARGFVFAGLEMMSVSADLANTFVNKTKERNDDSEENKADQNSAIRLASLPIDMTRAFFDTVGEYSACPKRVVDKFNSEYTK
jgi:hypothetical protein